MSQLRRNTTALESLDESVNRLSQTLARPGSLAPSVARTPRAQAFDATLLNTRALERIGSDADDATDRLSQLDQQLTDAAASGRGFTSVLQGIPRALGPVGVVAGAATGLVAGFGVAVNRSAQRYLQLQEVAATAATDVEGLIRTGRGLVGLTAISREQAEQQAATFAGRIQQLAGSIARPELSQAALASDFLTALPTLGLTRDQLVEVGAGELGIFDLAERLRQQPGFDARDAGDIQALTTVLGQSAEQVLQLVQASEEAFQRERADAAAARVPTQEEREATQRLAADTEEARQRINDNLDAIRGSFALGITGNVGGAVQTARPLIGAPEDFGLENVARSFLSSIRDNIAEGFQPFNPFGGGGIEVNVEQNITGVTDPEQVGATAARLIGEEVARAQR